jgi:thioredoxin 1
MKLLPILLLVFLLVSPKIVVISNSIDHSPELIEYLQEKLDVIAITAEELPLYQSYQYYVILGGPEAPEGIGEVVQGVLSVQEQEYLRNTTEYNLFIRVKNGKTYFVFAGADREQTKLAVTNLKDEILPYLPDTPVKWLENLDSALEKAKSENKLIYIDFYTNWCTYCIEMNEKTYKDPLVVALLNEKFVAVKLNRNDPANKEIIRQYRIYGQPVEMVITPDGEVIWGHTGYIDAEELYSYLMSALS